MSLAYVYTDRRELETVQAAFSNQTTYAYDSIGTLRTVELPGESKRLYEYDVLQRVTNVTYFRGEEGAPPAQTPRAAITPTQIDFAPVPIGSTQQMDLTLYNMGSASFVSFISSDQPAFTHDSVAPFTLLPQSSSLFHVFFAPSSTGLFSGTLTVDSDDPKRPQVNVPLSGTAGNTHLESPESVTGLNGVIGDKTVTVEWDLYPNLQQDFSHFQYLSKRYADYDWHADRSSACCFSFQSL